MSTPQITLADCLAEVNNALNYWYPIKGEAESGGASREECDARHVRLFQFRDRLQQQLREAGKAAAFDLAMVMAELRSVAAERDKSRQSLRAAEADAAETESVNSDLRTVNARLVADLAAAMERLNHAESIIMQ
jgi:hypothetical protein